MRRTKLEQQMKNDGKEQATIVVTGPESAAATPTTEEPGPLDTKEEPKEEEHPLQHTWYVSFLYYV